MYQRSKIWISDFWHEGRRYKRSWGEISKTAATEKDRKFRTEVLEGKHEAKAKKILFETFTEKYLEYARLNKKPGSAKRNGVSIKALEPYFKGKFLGTIHPFMVEQYKAKRREQGKAAATINRDIDCIRNMMKKAVEWGYLGSDALRDVRHLREKNEKMWVLVPEEEKKLLEACQKSAQRKNAKYLRDLVLFALHTGMREQEIFNLKKESVYMASRFLMVTDSKNHDPRGVPINDTLKEVLERRMKDQASEYVFHNSKRGKLTVLTNAFWYAVKQAGLVRTERVDGNDKKVRFRFHDLRHTFGTRLGMAGKDLKTIMEIMGHRTHAMGLRYQHPMPSHKLDAVRVLDEVPPVFTPIKKTEARVANLFR